MQDKISQAELSLIQISQINCTEDTLHWALKNLKYTGYITFQNDDFYMMIYYVMARVL